MTTVHFLRPYWFLAIVPLAYLCWQLTKVSLIANWRSVCDKHLLPNLLVVPKTCSFWLIYLIALGGFITILALAGPSWQKQTQPVYRSALGKVLVLNLSPSMNDVLGASKKIDRARFKILDFLHRQKDGLTGLLIYTDETHVISPLTEDNQTIANFVPVLDPNIMPSYGDETETALKGAVKLLQQTRLHQGSIILVTDKITHFAAAKKVAAALYREGYRLFIYDVSGQASSSEMQILARVGGGKVISITPNNADIDHLVTDVTMAVPTQIRQTNERGILSQDNGRLLLFLLLPLALIGFRRGYL